MSIHHKDDFFHPEDLSKHLRYLLLIEELGSIRAVADEINCDRGTIKYYIRLLRTEADDCLFWWDSKARITRWTEIGEVYLQKARDRQENFKDLKEFELVRMLRIKHESCNAQLIPSAILFLYEITYETTHNLFPGYLPRLFMCRKCCLRFAVPDTPETHHWISEHPGYFEGQNHFFLKIPTPSKLGA
jgi:hypothetical protein